MKTLVVKIGGSTLGSGDTTLEDLAALQKGGLPLVVVHGGGKRISEWLEKEGVAITFKGGLRATDARSLEVVIAVLAGLVNKELVASLNSLGARALGLSGVDGSLIQARIKDPELGYVGEIVKVNPQPLEAVRGAGYLPVVAPLGLGAEGVPLNINADTAAGEIAAALGAERLIFLTDVEGIRDGAGNLLRELSPAEIDSLMASGAISGGMIPKVEAALRALASGSSVQVIDGRSPHALSAALEGEELGTRIVK